MKALRRALALWPLALLGVSACSSGGGSSPPFDDRTRALTAPIVGGHLDTTTKGVVAVALSAHNQVAVICSGSLLAPNLVLTARHCVSQIGDGSSEAVDCENSRFTANFDARQMFVSTDSQPRSGSKLYSIKEVRVAPGSGSNEVCGYDLALLILSGSGVPAAEAAPIEPVLDHSPTEKQAFAAVGYGLQDPDDSEGQTAGTRMRFDESSVYCVGAECPRAAEVSNDEWVGNSPVCSGDSGGPALDAEGRVFGVTSRGDEQCTYALYSNVADWADFVRGTAITAASAGNYAPPAWATDDGNVGGGGASGGNSAGASSSSTSGATTGGSATGSAGTTSPPSGPASPSMDPLGSTCSGDCPGTYQCYSANRMPPGICVPSCNPTATDTCPGGYACSSPLNVCTPKGKSAQVSGSCSMGSSSATASGSSAFAALLGVAMLWLGRRRRQVA